MVVIHPSCMSRILTLIYEVMLFAHISILQLTCSALVVIVIMVMVIVVVFIFIVVVGLSVYYEC